MHRIAQVVQQLANDLALIFLLDAVQNGRVGRRGGNGKARFQMVSPWVQPGWELMSRLGSSRTA
jgi:hypothetical protein